MYCCNKNSYLQLQCGSIKPETINRLVRKARKFATEPDPHDSLPPLNRLCSEQPVHLVEEVDFTRRSCGFGRKALKLLKNDLLSFDKDVILKTVSTLGDMAMDPEKAIQIVHARIPKKLSHLLEKKDSSITERVCITFAKLAIVPEGKLALTNDEDIIYSLQMLLEEETHPSTLEQLGHCLENISTFVTTADELVDQGFILSILKVVAREVDDVVVVLLSTLKNLMYGNGNYIAMEYGAFAIMMQMLNRMDQRVHISALNCLMMMISTPLGKQLALDSYLVHRLNEMLGQSKNVELDAAIASVLMFATMTVEAKFRACKIKTLLPRLMKICRNPLHPSVQIFAFQTLLNLSTHFELRAVMQKKYIALLRKTKCSTSFISAMKESLLQDLSAPS